MCSRYKRVSKDTEDPAESAIQQQPVSVHRAAWRLTAAYFGARATRCGAVRLLVLVAVLLLANTGAFLVYSNIQRDFTTALEAKDMDKFYGGLFSTGVLILVALPLTGLHRYTGGILQLRWNAALTRRLARSYLEGQVAGQNSFYRLTLTGEIDNPDQRICDDVRCFVETFYKLVEDTVGTVLRVAGFSVVLFNVSPFICFGVLLYAVLGTVGASAIFGRSLMSYSNVSVQQGANMRYKLIHTRENSESIAFFRGGSAEWQRFDQLFAQLLGTTWHLILVGCGLAVFNRAFHWATFAVTPLLVAPKYMRGEVEFGVLTQVGMAFNVVLDGLALVMHNLGELSKLTVSVQRLHALEIALAAQEDIARQNAAGAGVTCIATCGVQPGVAAVLQVASVTLRTPLRKGAVPRTLVEDMSFEVLAGQSLLIVGASGIGKSSLLRAVAGLWNNGCGHVALERDRCYFMPQRPYMFAGSLREQLLYPSPDRPAVPEAELKQALSDVNLGYLLDHHNFSDVKDWSGLLSLGEQQRINFARLLLQHDIPLALLDEGTSACDPSNEQHLYELLQQRARSFVSVGHRPALRRFHTHALQLQHSRTAGAPALHRVMRMAEYAAASPGSE